jgi:hypothetical protein
MSESLADWLSRREAADSAARSAALTRAIADVLPERRPLRILDLGTGTGSNIRYLAPCLPLPQEWLVVDRDAALLSRIASPARDCRIDTRQANLGSLDADLFADRDLVTASALLDLVSASWLDALARHCRQVNAAALFALTYNGESRCDPEEPEDGLLLELMNRHQKQNDKGFGRAAGPDATDAAAAAFAAVGYAVRRERSNWDLAPTDRDLQRHLIEGWAEAGMEIAPNQATTIRDWLARRLAHVAAARSSILVGHEDLIAWNVT